MLLVAGSFSFISCGETAKEADAAVTEVTDEAVKKANEASEQIDEAMKKVEQQGEEVEKLLEDL